MKERVKMSKTKRMGRSRNFDTRIVRIRTENNGMGYFKTLIVLIAVALQLAAMVMLYLFLMNVFRWYVFVSLAFSIIACVHVLSTDKNGQSKAVWVMLLLLGFSVGFVLYWLSDVRVFFGRAKKRYAGIFERTERYKPLKSAAKVSKQSESMSVLLENMGGFRAYNNTRQQYFSSGAQLFDDVLERIKSAEKFVFIEFFIIADGILLERMLKVLGPKAQSGVDVRIIYDDLGSGRMLKRKTRKRIRKMGIKLEAFNRITPRFTVAMNYRDHRKIIIVDGKTAYTGGSNLADEYVNEKRMHGYWKDNGLRLDGEAVDAFTLTFLRQWEFTTRQKTEYDGYLGLYEPIESTAAVVPYADGLDYEKAVGKGAFAHLISTAKERLWIMTPYFVPDDTVMGLIADRAQAGVDVRIILPWVPDKPYVYAVSRDNADRIIPQGVKVYLMKNSFVHSKTMLTESGAIIGSINLDLRSFYQQFECAVFTDDMGVLKQLEDDYNSTFADSVSVDKEKKKNIFKRMITGFLRIFEPLM